MEEETHVALVEHIVNHLLVELCTEGTCGERLCLATCEDRTSVWHWQWADLTPYRTDLVGLTAVEAYALVEDATAHCVTHHVVVVFLHECHLLLKLLFGEVCMSGSVSLLEVGEDLVESILTSLLVESLLRNIVCLWIKLVVDLLAQVFVVHLMAVFTLHVGAEFL